MSRHLDFAAWQVTAVGVACAWAVANLTVVEAAMLRRWWWARRRAPQRFVGGGAGRCVVLRPCAGADADLEQCLRSVAAVRCSLPLEVRMGVMGEADAALPVVRRVAEELRSLGCSASVVVVPEGGPNRKVAILEQLSRELNSQLNGDGDREGGDDETVWWINADSNVDLAGFELDALLTPLQDGSGCAASWAPPTELIGDLASGSLGYRRLGQRAAVAVLAGSLHAFPLLCALDRQSLVGKLFAVRGAALRQIGGFAALRDYLGEDVELSRRLYQNGQRVALCLEAAPVRSGVRSWRQAVERQARWMTVVRCQRPWRFLSYPLLFCNAAPVLGLAMWGISTAPGWTMASLVILAAARLLASLGAQHWCGRKVRLGAAIVDVLLAEALLSVAWLRALTSRRTGWRGRQLQVVRGGRLRDVTPTPASSPLVSTVARHPGKTALGDMPEPRR